MGPVEKERRTHVTTTLPVSLAEQLDAYVAQERVNKNQIFELAIGAFLLKERQRKQAEEK